MYTYKRKVTIVEDNIEVANSLKHILEKLQYEVAGIFTFGEDAIEVIKKSGTDLILMDVNLAGDMTGLKAAEIINKKQDIPIIFLTANDDKETLLKASRSNLYGFVLKPFDENELNVAIRIAFYKYEIHMKQLNFYRNIEAMHETASRLQNCLSLDQVIKISTEMAHKICNFDKHAVYKVNYNELDYIAGTYTPSLNNYEFNYIKQLAEDTLKDGLPFMFNSLGQSPLEPKNDLDFESCISSPLVDIGVFQFFSEEKNSFDEDHLRLINLLLGHTYEAIKRIQLEQELRDQAIRDPLTNAFNRFYLYKIIEKEKILAKSQHRKIAFMMVDINNLKKVNDNYGHQMGDKVIQIVSSIIVKEISSKDILIRYGGDEFLILLPDPQKDLQTLEKKILQRTSSWNKNISEFDFEISFATGVKMWDSEENRSIENILIEVDEQMYINKQKQKEIS